MTQERAHFGLRASKQFKADILIVDEAHAIQDGARGILLQTVIEEFIDRNPTMQMIFSGPNIANMAVFSRLFCVKDLFVSRSTKKTVTQNFYQVKVESAKKGRITVSLRKHPAKEHIDVSTFELGQTLASRKDRLVHISNALGSSRANLIFCNGAAEAENVALKLADLLSDHHPTEAQVELSSLARELVHPIYCLTSCLLRGVAFHYANIPTLLRVGIEEGVRDGHIKFLVATSTLLYGVNLPFKTLFLLNPKRGSSKAMPPADFWNLCGRAGRLRREFQGDIFLIDYDDWDQSLLLETEAQNIQPALANVIAQEEPLSEVIRGEYSGRYNDELESGFTKLLLETGDANLRSLIYRIGLDAESDLGTKLLSAIDQARERIKIPTEVLRVCPSVSPDKQEALLKAILTLIEEGDLRARRLVPRHPREKDAFASYETILQMCYRAIFKLADADKTHRLHALLSLRWMQGWPLPRIIASQIDYRRGASLNKVIRETLELIEQKVRFEVVRAFSLYIAILGYAFEMRGLLSLKEDLIDIPSLLEIGGSDQTMLSLISLGLSRSTSARLNEISARKQLNVEGALSWLRTQNLEGYGFPQIVIREIQSLLAKAS